MSETSVEGKIFEQLRAQNAVANTTWLDIKLILNKTCDRNDYVEAIGKLDILRGTCKVLASESAKLRLENAKLNERIKELEMLISTMEKES